MRLAISGEIRGSEHNAGKWELSLPDLYLHFEDRMGGDHIPPDSPLGLKYWGNNPWTKDKKKKKRLNTVVFIWTQTPILALSVFWPKFGSDEDWVCQLLSLPSKSHRGLRRQLIMLCWQRGLVVFFPLRVGDQKDKGGGNPRTFWDLLPSMGPPLGSMPPPSNPQNGTGPPPATVLLLPLPGERRRGRGAEPPSRS